MTAETWNTIEWVAEIYDFVIWWCILPFIAACVTAALIEVLTRK